jgi:hypothetical protein
MFHFIPLLCGEARRGLYRAILSGSARRHNNFATWPELRKKDTGMDYELPDTKRTYGLQIPKTEEMFFLTLANLNLRLLFGGAL